MKIAVTTASGNLGSAIITALIKEIGSENVVGIARTPSKAEHLGVEIRKGDYNNRQELEIALKGIDAVLLVSGIDAPENRIGQHRNVIEAAKTSGVKKIVYTSITGDPSKTSFSPIVSSNRQTEEDVKNSGLNWSIGRNGLYLEPDLEYIDTYIKDGKVSNCAGAGKCAYTSRDELAFAYAKLLIDDKHNGLIYNLAGEPITQKQLTEYLNINFQTNLTYERVSVDFYANDRKQELGEFIGNIISGIYESILNGAFNIESDFEKATGRKHKEISQIISEFKNK